MKRLYFVLFIVVPFLLISCRSNSIKKENEAKILRLTYDVAWFLERDEKLVRTQKNKSQGISYDLKVKGFRSFRLSSYAEENRYSFDYIEDGTPEKVHYEKMQNGSSAYIIFLNTVKSKIYYRWEWTFKGKGIVMEAVSDQPNGYSVFMQRVQKSLKVYY